MRSFIASCDKVARLRPSNLADKVHVWGMNPSQRWATSAGRQRERRAELERSSMSQELEDSDDFDVVNIDSESEEHDLPAEAHPDLLRKGRLFVVSTARALGGHRPSCTFEGTVFEVCTTPKGDTYLQRVLEPSDDAPALSLSLRYEPPSPKFSSRHPESTSYRVKLLQGTQFIYLHRGLPKVCQVDRHARCLSWGSLQVVMRDASQLDSVLSVLRYMEVQHTQLWSPQVSRLWLGPEADEGQQAGAGEDAKAAGAPGTVAAEQSCSGASETTAGPGQAGAQSTSDAESARPSEARAAEAGAPGSGVGAAAGSSEAAALASTAAATDAGAVAEPPGRAPHGPRRWSFWTALVQRFLPNGPPAPASPKGFPPPLGGVGRAGVYGAGFLLGAAVVAALLWRAHRKCH